MAPANLPDNRALATLSGAGDINAPPGSQAWAIAVRLELRSRIKNTESDARHLQRLARLMEEHQGYTQLPKRTGRPFASWREFCVTEPPYGLGYDPEMLRLVVEERMTAQALAASAQPLNGHGGDRKTTLAHNLETVEQRGESSEYLTARIARDRPDILDEMKAGKYPSVRAAALDAGIVKPRISIPADPAGAAAALTRRFSRADLTLLVELLAEQIAERG